MTTQTPEPSSENPILERLWDRFLIFSEFIGQIAIDLWDGSHSILSKIGKFIKFVVSHLFGFIKRCITNYMDGEKRRKETEETLVRQHKETYYPKVLNPKELQAKLRDYPDFLFSFGETVEHGELIDFWSELIEGHGPTAAQFAGEYDFDLTSRQIGSMQRKTGYLTAPGFNPRNRHVEFVKRGTATIIIMIAIQGNDLYLSVRSYVKPFLNVWRIVLLTLAILLVACFFTQDLVPNSWLVERDQYGSYIASSKRFPLGILWTTGVVLIPIFAVGIQKHRDPFVFFKETITSLQLDDVSSLASVTHRSLMNAASKMGIDISKLQPRIPISRPRRPLI